jgi:hypothetical protein
MKRVLPDLFAPGDLYHNLSARGSLVFCLAQRDSYINSRVCGQSILPDYFSFSCSIALDFLHHFVENLSLECMEALMVVSISFL